MLGAIRATNVVITSEWSSIVYNTQMTDVTGLENGSFSYVVTNQVELLPLGLKIATSNRRLSSLSGLNC